MTLKQLQYFQKVAKTGNYTKAAQLLFISQPALSFSIQELEKELNAPLLKKDGRTVELTKYGEILLGHAERIFGEIESAVDSIDCLVNSDRGHITLSYISAMSAVFIPRIVRAFCETPENHSVKFTLLEQPTKEAEESVLSGKSDVGFGSRPECTSLTSFPVYMEEMALIVPPGHPLASREEVSIKETKDCQFIAYNKSSGLRHENDRVFEVQGIKRNIVHEAVDNIMVAQLVAAGMGVAVVPRRYGDSRYHVACLRLTDYVTPRTLYMFWKEERFISPAARRFLGFVKEQAALLPVQE